MSCRQALRSVGVLALVLAAFSLWPLTASAADTIAFTIKDRRVVESSGLARDPVANLYWTANGSAATGVAYGITPKGKVAGTLNFRADPRDVEAVALGKDRLYLGDIGDKSGQRPNVTVYYFNNPRANGLTVSYHSWDFRYPDGRHDAETLLVDSQGRLYIVTKGGKAGIYAAPTKPRTAGVNALTKLGNASALVTDGVFLPGDKQIALLTSGGVSVIDAKTYQQVATAPIPKQPQAESLTVSLDGKSLLVGSTGKESKVYAIPMPAVATGGPSSSSTGAPDSGDQSDDPGADADTGSGGSRRGTFLAIGLAGFVAVVAGVVVALVRKP
jgi:hypothetical protein